MAFLLPAELKAGACLRLGAGGEAARLRDVPVMQKDMEEVQCDKRTVPYERVCKRALTICAGWGKGSAAGEDVCRSSAVVRAAR